MTISHDAPGVSPSLPVLHESGFDPRSTSTSDELVVGAERAVLGWLLTPANAVAAREEVERLDAREFYYPPHEHIYDAIQRTVGVPDTYMRVLDLLIGRNAPRALDMLNQTLAVYLSECMRAADCYDLDTMRFYSRRIKQAHTQRHGRVLLAEFAKAFESGDEDAAAMSWATLGSLLDGPAHQLPQGTHRNVDLTPYLDGTHAQLTPDMGGVRDDGLPLLYRGLWHTCIAPTAAGKSWFALWHCIQEIRAGNTVVYAHFEEPSPKGTIGRLMKLAPDLTPEQIKEHFRWLDCSDRWSDSEFRQSLPEKFSLVVLDGVNAACSQHGFDPSTPEALGWYKQQLLNPIMKTGAAALSLGHPVKSIERQWERHGFGYTGWLDDVNGIAFRLVPSKKTPIGKGQFGHSALYAVKDREGGVQEHSVLDTSDRKEGWYRIGSFKVDDRPEQQNTSAWVNVAEENDEVTVGTDPIDDLAEQILAVLPKIGGRYEGTRALQDALTASKLTFNKSNVGPAVQRLVTAGRIRELPVKGKAKPGEIVPLGDPRSAGHTPPQTPALEGCPDVLPL